MYLINFVFKFLCLFLPVGAIKWFDFQFLSVVSSSKSDLVGILDTYLYSLFCYNLIILFVETLRNMYIVKFYFTQLNLKNM